MGCSGSVMLEIKSAGYCQLSNTAVFGSGCVRSSAAAWTDQGNERRLAGQRRAERGAPWRLMPSLSPGWLSAKSSRPRLHNPRPCPDSSAKNRLFCDETVGVAVSRAAGAINAWHRPPPPKPQRSKKEGRKIDSTRHTKQPKIAAARPGYGGVRTYRRSPARLWARQ